ncbi:MAG: DnaJ-class molecular chaperone [Pseudohongiellaceae bacterium]
MINSSNKKEPRQALVELQAILRKPYQDVCNVCKGAGSITSTSTCPKCKGSGQRLLRLL